MESITTNTCPDTSLNTRSHTSPKHVKISKNALSKDSILLSSLTDFFNESENLKTFLNIYNKKSKISLRVLDWFVTNYSKKNNTIYEIEKRGKLKNFIVYLEYKAQLRAYSKKQFDPFCRRERIVFYINEHEILTTIGQLNFFRWAIENKIIQHVEKNLNEIDNDMNTSIKSHYTSKKKEKKKRTQLSISATKQIRKHDVKIIVNFD